MSVAAPTRTLRRPLVLACVMVAMFMVAIEITIVATAMPEIVRHLGDFSLYAWVFSAFLMSQATTTVIYGRLADLFGRKPVLIAGIAIFLVGSLLCGLAWSMLSLILFRLLQGLGAGAIQPVASTIVGDLYSAEERAQIQGYLSSVWAVAAVIGPLAGGVIIGQLSWPWIFWINIPLGVVTIAGLLLFLPETVQRRPASLDYPGAALFALAIVSLLMVLTLLGGESDWRGTGSLIFGALFLLSLPLFLWQEARTASPMVDLSLWSQRTIAAGNGATFLSGMTLIGLTSLLPIFVQGALGRSALAAGFTLTALVVGWPLASAVSGWFFRRFGTAGTARLGTGLIVLGAAPLLALGVESGLAVPCIASFVVGFGMGLLSITCLVLIQGSVDWSRRGAATASNLFARTLGSTLGVAVLGGVLNLGLHAALRDAGESDAAATLRIRAALGEAGTAAADPGMQAAMQHGLHLAFWAVLALAVVTFLLALMIPQRELSHLSGPATPRR
ncbi:MDR family MFS transporter [Roseomonas sp. BN140053]|uniref:MDR family MFS transporter n=1 Tax=Roseomonas sp. BN140053 TaxID=3391898 RepID=UPI0039E741F2